MDAPRISSWSAGLELGAHDDAIPGTLMSPSNACSFSSCTLILFFDIFSADSSNIHLHPVLADDERSFSPFIPFSSHRFTDYDSMKQSKYTKNRSVIIALPWRCSASPCLSFFHYFSYYHRWVRREIS